jgi:hypothetical protein
MEYKIDSKDYIFSKLKIEQSNNVKFLVCRKLVFVTKTFFLHIFLNTLLSIFDFCSGVRRTKIVTITIPSIPSAVIFLNEWSKTKCIQHFADSSTCFFVIWKINDNYIIRKMYTELFYENHTIMWKITIEFYIISKWTRTQ